MDRDHRPIRVLHVLGGLERGGVETWLLSVLRRLDRSRFQFDFAVHTQKACAYDDDVRQLGSEIHPVPYTRQPCRYGVHLFQLLQDKRYDVIHSHVHHFSGYVLGIALLGRVPARIAHSHNDSRRRPGERRLSRSLYRRGMKRLIFRAANLCIAASEPAACSLFGVDWHRNPQCRLLYCAVDTDRFVNSHPNKKLRAQLELAEKNTVVGCIGSLTEQKNHRFLIEIAAELVRLNSNVRVLLVGDGPLRSEIERRVRQRGLEDYVMLLGSRSDIPELMALMNVLVLPSLYEGLPVVGLESLSAGLPIVVSNTVTPELAVIPELANFIPLQAGPTLWASELLKAASIRPITPEDARRKIENSRFGIAHGVRELCNLYENLLD